LENLKEQEEKAKLKVAVIKEMKDFGQSHIKIHRDGQRNTSRLRYETEKQKETSRNVEAIDKLM
jgi:hypothetical protein